MSSKVLLADDSLTIQKVIKITLANEPFTLIDCNNEEELMTSIRVEKPELVLLDFNLSDERSGYELAKEIKTISDKTQILMLYGTFDTIDEEELRASGVSDKIVKPFDGTKFINICKQLIEDSANLDNEGVDEEKVEKSFSTEQELTDEDDSKEKELSDIGEEWEVNSPKPQTMPMPSPDDFENTSNFDLNEIQGKDKLSESMEDWGMEIPGKIDEADKTDKTDAGLELPPVIEEDNELPQESPFEMNGEESAKEISLKDLNLESTEEEEQDDQQDHFEERRSEEKPSSKLVSLDELSPIPKAHENIQEHDITDRIEMDLSALMGTETDDDVKNIEDQISDGDSDDESFWEVDEVISEEVSFEENLPDEESAPGEQTSPQQLPEEIKETNKSNAFELADLDREDLEEKLKPIIEEFVKDYCKESIQKVAWEIIPDLAENLIKQELEKIADSVISGSHSQD